jgi:hypothetical protein
MKIISFQVESAMRQRAQQRADVEGRPLANWVAHHCAAAVQHLPPSLGELPAPLQPSQLFIRNEALRETVQVLAETNKTSVRVVMTHLLKIALAQ